MDLLVLLERVSLGVDRYEAQKSHNPEIEKQFLEEFQDIVTAIVEAKREGYITYREHHLNTKYEVPDAWDTVTGVELTERGRDMLEGAMKRPVEKGSP